jgi:hypothetical protein
MAFLSNLSNWCRAATRAHGPGSHRHHTCHRPRTGRHVHRCVCGYSWT